MTSSEHPCLYKGSYRRLGISSKVIPSSSIFKYSLLVRSSWIYSFSGNTILENRNKLKLLSRRVKCSKVYKYRNEALHNVQYYLGNGKIGSLTIVSQLKFVAGSMPCCTCLCNVNIDSLKRMRHLKFAAFCAPCSRMKYNKIILLVGKELSINIVDLRINLLQTNISIIICNNQLAFAQIILI